MSNHPSISRLLLPPKYGGCSYSESLELLNLVSSWLREAKRWWSIKLTSQLFLWLHSLFIVGSVENHPLPNAPWKNRKNVLTLIEILLANFCSSRRKSSNALFIIASMSKWFDDRWCLSHFSSTSQALECQQKPCHNRPMRGYTWIQYTGTIDLLRTFTGVPSLSPNSPSLFSPCFLYIKWFNSLPILVSIPFDI